MVKVSILKPLNIDEISREVCYGGSIEPLGYFIDSGNIIFSINISNSSQRVFIVDRDITKVIDRFSVGVQDKLDNLSRNPCFRTDIVVTA